MHATHTSTRQSNQEIGSQFPNLESSSQTTINVGQVSQPVIFNQKPTESKKKLTESHIHSSNKKTNKKNSSIFGNLFKPKAKPFKYGTVYHEGDLVIIDGEIGSITFA